MIRGSPPANDRDLRFPGMQPVSLAHENMQLLWDKRWEGGRAGGVWGVRGQVAGRVGGQRGGAGGGGCGPHRFAGGACMSAACIFVCSQPDNAGSTRARGTRHARAGVYPAWPTASTTAPCSKLKLKLEEEEEEEEVTTCPPGSCCVPSHIRAAAGRRPAFAGRPSCASPSPPWRCTPPLPALTPRLPRPPAPRPCCSRYWVTWKADGTRYMVLIAKQVGGGGCGGGGSMV